MLEVKGLCKEYPGFSLKDVSFKIEKGFITGFIGMNGAGKSTTLKAMLNIVNRKSGEVKIFGKNVDAFETEIKQDIALMLGPVTYYPKTRINKLVEVYKRFYSEWSDEAFDGYMQKFKIDVNKKVTELSAGMKVKFGLGLALSHNAKLIILDEPTSGLDPIARDELLDLFRDIVSDGTRSILFSTHITSDLDKCADYILFIRNGEIIADAGKDELLEQHIIVKGGTEKLDGLKEKLVGFKKNSFGFTGLGLKKDFKKLPGLVLEKPDLEEIMLYYNLGETGKNCLQDFAV